MAESSLFTVDGRPLRFSIARIGKLRETYRTLIEQNGGVVCEPSEQNLFLRLGDQSVAHARNDLYSCEYIQHAIKHNSLLDKEAFKLHPGPNAPAPPSKGRSAFSKEDDAILIDIFVKNKVHLNGNALYKDLAAKYPHHTWHSWRDRAVRILLPKLEQSGQLERLRAAYANNVPPPENTNADTTNPAQVDSASVHAQKAVPPNHENQSIHTLGSSSSSTSKQRVLPTDFQEKDSISRSDASVRPRCGNDRENNPSVTAYTNLTVSEPQNVQSAVQSSKADNFLDEFDQSGEDEAQRGRDASPIKVAPNPVEVTASTHLDVSQSPKHAISIYRTIPKSLESTDSTEYTHRTIPRSPAANVLAPASELITSNETSGSNVSNSPDKGTSVRMNGHTSEQIQISKLPESFADIANKKTEFLNSAGSSRRELPSTKRSVSASVASKSSPGKTAAPESPSSSFETLARNALNPVLRTFAQLHTHNPTTAPSISPKRLMNNSIESKKSRRQSGAEMLEQVRMQAVRLEEEREHRRKSQPSSVYTRLSLPPSTKIFNETADLAREATVVLEHNHVEETFYLSREDVRMAKSLMEPGSADAPLTSQLLSEPSRLSSAEGSIAASLNEKEQLPDRKRKKTASSSQTETDLIDTPSPKRVQTQQGQSQETTSFEPLFNDHGEEEKAPNFYTLPSFEISQEFETAESEEAIFGNGGDTEEIVDELVLELMDEYGVLKADAEKALDMCMFFKNKAIKVLQCNFKVDLLSSKVRPWVFSPEEDALLTEHDDWDEEGGPMQTLLDVHGSRFVGLRFKYLMEKQKLRTLGKSRKA
ncbi:hypothetical protein BJ741DRAFT_602616 [Chytriomyces cf. hyalinus JEL632]|nr:hypothetical protein BJ741DRAFT_602616 [Chytriomyces cf. hyalinus JEL632]